MQQDKDLKTRIEPPKMDYLAEQIIARSKSMSQDQKARKVFSFPAIFKKPQLSYALVAACCVLVVTTVVNVDSGVPSEYDVSEVAEVGAEDWDEFWRVEEETMLAGL